MMKLKPSPAFDEQIDMSGLLFLLLFLLFPNDSSSAAVLEFDPSHLGRHQTTHTHPRSVFPARAFVEDVEWSSHFRFETLMRTMAHDGGINVHIRKVAYLAAQAQRNMEILEVTSGIPFTSIEMAFPRAIHEHGDFYTLYINPQKEVMRHAAPQVAATVVTSADRTQEFLDTTDSNLLADGILARQLARSLPIQHTRPTRAEISAAYANARNMGQLNIRTGDPIATLQALSLAGKKFDLIFSTELARSDSRPQFMEYIQHLLQADGRAYFPMTWWAANGLSTGTGISTRILFADTVVQADGGSAKLGDYLAQTFPQYFELETATGNPILVVKGTRSNPLHLPQFNLTPTTEKTDGGFPVMSWTLERP